MELLKVDNINVYYGSIHAIKGISFHVNEGEIVTLIGANGAGKSTILNTISGLLHSKTGSIEFLGQPISHVPPHKIVGAGNELLGLLYRILPARTMLWLLSKLYG